MKKQIAFLLALALLLAAAGCAAPAEVNDPPQHTEPVPIPDAADMTPGTQAAAGFGLRLLQAGWDGTDNALISPLSVLCALSMTANGARGETLAQMEQVLGMPVQELNEYLRSYAQALTGNKDAQLRLANSIWFTEDPLFTVKEEFLQQAEDDYAAGIYRTAFDEATLGEINGWVSKNTDGMIPKILEQLPDEAVMYLVNALAFDAKWAVLYEESQILEDSFTTESGAKKTVEFMYAEESRYLEDENTVGFLKYYEGCSYAFAALLPREGLSVAEYVANLTPEKLANLLQNPQAVPVRTAIPKFEAEYSCKLKEVLQQMGMELPFDPDFADFRDLGTYEDGNICISQVLHKTFISVNEKGTRAAAATIVEMITYTSVAQPQQPKQVYLDRPFVYMILDTQTNLPVFIGVMMEP